MTTAPAAAGTAPAQAIAHTSDTIVPTTRLAI
jgi:hypothetical protein